MKYLKEKQKTQQKTQQKIEKTFESFIGNILGKQNKYDNLENISKQSNEVDQETKSKILDVENFNNWLINDYSYGGYTKGSGAGIVGRRDKLSYSMVVAYFIDQGVECTDIEIKNFQDKISDVWRTRN